MEFELALYRVYERILTNINLEYPIITRRSESSELEERRRSRGQAFIQLKHIIYIIEGLLFLIGILLLILLSILHLKFVNQPGCLSDIMKSYDVAYNSSFHDTSSSLLRFSYNASNFFPKTEQSSPNTVDIKDKFDEMNNFNAMYEYSSSLAMIHIGMKMLNIYIQMQSPTKSFTSLFSSSKL